LEYAFIFTKNNKNEVDIIQILYKRAVLKLGISFKIIAKKPIFAITLTNKNKIKHYGDE